jgi:signal transduction histidine kinase
MYMRSWFQAREKTDAEVLAAVPSYTAMAKSGLVVAGSLYFALAVAHFFYLPKPMADVMVPIALASSVFLFGLRSALWLGYIRFQLIRYAIFVILVVAWVNSTMQLWASHDAMQATNLAIIMIACGTLLLSWEQYVAINLSCLISWVAAILSAGPAMGGPEWVHYSVFLSQAFLFSAVAFYWRRNALIRNIELSRERARARSNEHLSLLAAQSKAIEAERNLRRALDADASKSMFLANMSHELRTPLNSVVGFAQLLRERTEIAGKPELVREYAEYIQSSGSHLLGLINQILDLSRANVGVIVLNETCIDLGETLIEITRLMRPQASEAKVGMHVHAGAGQFMLKGDDLRVRQVVTNLIGNAVKFTPAGGRVDVSAAVDASSVIIEVRDTGPGIAMQDQARVFEPFIQADAGLDKRHQGTGLGLAITRKLVELHGGTISVKSVLGEGCAFTVRFPRERLMSEAQRKTA